MEHKGRADSEPRLRIQNNTGVLSFGSGSATPDVSLSRSAEGALIVDGHLEPAMMMVMSTITFASEDADTIIQIPANAVVWDVQMEVRTSFNDSGTDLVDVGTTSASSFLISNEDVSCTGFLSLTPTNTPYRSSGGAYIIATYDGQNNDANTGVADVYIKYSIH